MSAFSVKFFLSEIVAWKLSSHNDLKTYLCTALFIHGSCHGIIAKLFALHILCSGVCKFVWSVCKVSSFTRFKQTVVNCIGAKF